MIFLNFNDIFFIESWCIYVKKASCAQRIRHGLLIRNIKQKDLCDMTGIPKSAMSQYCKGTLKPKQDRTALIAEALNVDEAWLMGYDVPMERNRAPEDQPHLPSNMTPMPKMKKIPLIGQIACGEPILAEHNVTDYIDLPGHIHANYALTCKGDIMINARIYDGDIVYIHMQNDVENGEIAAVRIGEEATLKKVYYNKNRVILRACNPLFEDMEYEGQSLDEIEILGKAIAFTSWVR